MATDRWQESLQESIKTTVKLRVELNSTLDIVLSMLSSKGLRDKLSARCFYRCVLRDFVHLIGLLSCLTYNTFTYSVKEYNAAARSEACGLVAFERCNRGGESPSRHGVTSAFFFCVVLSCEDRGLAMGRSPFQGILPDV
jgi:hypothetical protein